MCTVRVLCLEVHGYFMVLLSRGRSTLSGVHKQICHTYNYPNESKGHKYPKWGYKYNLPYL